MNGHTKGRVWLGMAALALLMRPALADIVVGVSHSLSGPAAGLGTQFQRAMEEMPREIAGEKVRYILLDDNSDPSAAVRNVRKLVTEDHADIILAPSTAPAAYAIAPVLADLHVPLICTAPIEFYGDKADWLGAPLMANTSWMSVAIADMKKRGIKRVAYIGFSDTYGDQVYNALVSVAKDNGIEIVTNERFARADTSVTGQVLRILAARPDAVMVGGSTSPAALPNNALLERNFGKPIYNTPVVVGPDFRRLVRAPKQVLSATFLLPAARQLPDSNPVKAIAVPMVEKYEKTYGPGTADVQTGEAFDSGILLTHMATEALKTARPGTPEFRAALNSSLHQVKDLPATMGFYTFRKGDPWGLDERSVVLMELVDGAWKIVQ